MTKIFEETTAVITLDETTQIDAEVLGKHLQREMNQSGFELTRLQLMHDAGFRLSGPLLEMIFFLDQGSPNGFLITVKGADAVAEARKLRRERFRLCSAVVECVLAAVTAERVAMYHAGVSYVTVRGQDVVVRRDRSARLRARADAPKRRGRAPDSATSDRPNKNRIPVTRRVSAIML